MFDTVARWWRNRTVPPTPAAHLEIDDEGFVIVDRKGTRFDVRWSSVTAIATYKYDLITVDEIVLGFELSDHPGMTVEVSEEWTGFAELLEPLERKFSISRAWYPLVMKPAFARNYRELFRRVPSS